MQEKMQESRKKKMQEKPQCKLKTWELKASDYLLIGWLFVFMLICSSNLTNFIIAQWGKTSFASVLSAFSMQALFLLFAIFVNYRYSFGLFEKTLSLPRLIKFSLKYFTIGLFSVFGINICINLIANALNYEFAMQDAVDLWLSLDGNLEFFIALVSTVIIAPIAEELIFRGLLFRFLLQTRLGSSFAMIATSLIFALIHASTFAFFALFIFSYLLCFIYKKYGDLRLCMAVHALFNFVNVALLALMSGVE